MEELRPGHKAIKKHVCVMLAAQKKRKTGNKTLFMVLKM
jgi:hypothetical protein